MRLSIFRKTFAGYCLVTILLTALILSFSLRVMREKYVDVLAQDLGDLGCALGVTVTPLLQEARFEELDELVKRVGRSAGARITVIDPEGRVLADSEKDPLSMENHGMRPEIRQAIEGESGRSIRFSSTVGKNMLYVAVRVEREGELLGILRTSLFLDKVDEFFGRIRFKILQIALIAIAVSMLAAFLVSRTISNPIRRLASAAGTVASGDFSTRVLLKNTDELGDLANSFNCMTERVRDLFDEISSQKEELRGVISSIREGLLVLSEDGRVKLSNESFSDYVDSPDVRGRFYWEVLQAPALGDLVREVSAGGMSVSREIDFQEKTFLCSGAFIPSRKETVLVFHDITEIKELEKVKRDFVVNVSHELRTPLAAIKGFVETLEEGVTGDQKRYVEIIKVHTDRLINIVKDLLTLSQLEEPSAEEPMGQVDATELVADVTRLFERQLMDKGLAFRTCVEEGVPPIQGDYFRLTEMLMNIMDNAVKYTERGGIEVSVRRRDDKVELEVKDTGIGIPEHCLGRVFERFFVVDKARSRELGGTGLGLSIAKHIVLLHNGTLEVKSVLGSGTTVRIVLPVASS